MTSYHKLLINRHFYEQSLEDLVALDYIYVEDNESGKQTFNLSPEGKCWVPLLCHHQRESNGSYQPW
jgi:hypothetical protein